MKTRSIACALLAASASLAFSATMTPAAAQQDGALVGLHAKVRIGNKVCMADHSHFGSSSGQPSRKAAEVAAIRDWASFTAWEYGNHWGNFQMAVGRSVSCSQSGGWGCNVEARPCRRR